MVTLVRLNLSGFAQCLHGRHSGNPIRKAEYYSNDYKAAVGRFM